MTYNCALIADGPAQQLLLFDLYTGPWVRLDTIRNINSIALVHVQNALVLVHVVKIGSSRNTASENEGKHTIPPQHHRDGIFVFLLSQDSLSSLLPRK